MSKIEEMETFVRVVDAGTITLAAQRMHLAKSAVSRRLSELEERLQAQLFIRTTRKLRLTDTGQSFYERCLSILADIEETEAQISQVHGELRGRLRVALPRSFGQLQLQDALNDFVEEHPALFLDLDFNDRRVDIIQEGFDVAIRIGKLEDSTLIARRLAPIRMLVCASPTYLRTRGIPASPDELLRHRVLAYSLSSDPAIRYRAEDGSYKSLVLPRAMTANSGEFLLEAGIRGLGLLWEPTFIAYRAVEQGLLVPLLTDFQWATGTAHILYPRTRHLSARVRKFVDFMVARFAGLPPWDRQLVAMGYICADTDRPGNELRP